MLVAGLRLRRWVSGGRWRLLVPLSAVLVLAAACGASAGSEAGTEATPATEATTVPTPSPSPSPLPTATPAPTSTPEPTPTPLPTPTPVPQRLCRSDPDEYTRRVATLEESVAVAMEGFDGTFGFALHDLDCDATATVNADHRQYTASTGKLPFVIAALRAVREGTIQMEDVEDDLEEVLINSSDDAANRIVALVDPEEVREVLRVAGMSDQTDFGDSWSNFFSTASDLTLLWTALLRGELLDEEFTELVLGLASQAVVDPAFETFYADFDNPGIEFGQKVGHAVIFAPPYYMVGSGYLLPASGTSEGVAATLVVTSASLNAQRKDVFPLVLEFVEEAFQELQPG